MPLSDPGADCPAIEAEPLTISGGLVSLFYERPVRVIMLLIATCALGIYDLMHTLMYMKTIGMVELNPLARYMVETGGVQQLVLFKLFTLALSCGILYFLRRTRAAEVCAYAGCFVMVLLTLYWFVYNGHVVQLAEVWQNTSRSHDPRWVYVY